jgi:hypothetical protein
MAGKASTDRLQSLKQREEETRKKLEEARKARKVLESLIRTKAQKQERKERTRLLVQMGGILASIGFERLDQAEALKQHLLELYHKGDWAPNMIKKIFKGELPEKFIAALAAPPQRKSQDAPNRPAQGKA